MSADNFLTVKRNGEKWAVFNGNASSGWQGVREKEQYDTRDEAIDAAQRILGEEMIEYGLAYIEPINIKEGGTDHEHSN